MNELYASYLRADKDQSQKLHVTINLIFQEEVAATNLAKYRQLQQQYDDAEERAEMAENSLSKLRAKNRSISAGPGGLATSVTYLIGYVTPELTPPLLFMARQTYVQNIKKSPAGSKQMNRYRTIAKRRTKVRVSEPCFHTPSPHYSPPLESNRLFITEIHTLIA